MDCRTGNSWHSISHRDIFSANRKELKWKGMELYWLIYLALGILTGLLAGLFGIGGGGLMVPLLTSIFLMQGFSPDHVVHMALATSMAAIMATSLSSLRAHHRHQAVLWPVAVRLATGVLAGTFLAATLTSHISGVVLASIFTLFMGYVAARMIVPSRHAPGRELPASAGLAAAGFGIGSVSALVAIGGGSLTVPFLTWCSLPIHKAIGTSAAIGFPIAVAGTAGYLVGGMGTEGLPGWSAGYIYLPAAIWISMASMLTAPLGASLAHRLPVPAMRRWFGLFLLALALLMLYRIIPG